MSRIKALQNLFPIAFFLCQFGNFIRFKQSTLKRFCIRDKFTACSLAQKEYFDYTAGILRFILFSPVLHSNQSADPDIKP